MGIKVSQGFVRTSGEPIDSTLTLTFSEMRSMVDSSMPDVYLAVCKDDGKLYIYDKSNTVDENTGKYRVFEGGSSLPDGGTTGQVLAKKSDADGDAEWIVDTGKDLNKLVQWGTNNSQSPIIEFVPTVTDSTQDRYHRVILHIPIQGSALQGIEATEASLKQYLKTRFKIRYNTELNGTVVFTTTTEDTAGDGIASFGMKTNLSSGYDDSRLYIYLNETTISDNTLHLAVNYYVKFSASQTNHHSKPQNVVLLANDGYTFGITPVGDPYYIHNSTKIALDDLQINDMGIPTDWGVAKTGNLKMYMTNKQSYQYLWFGNLGFTSVDDYMIFVDITGGMEAAWGKPTVLVSNKSATEAGISLECDSAEATWFNVNYVIIGKGYGNLVEGGGSYDDTELRNRIATVETQKATGYFERTDFDIPLNTAGQPVFALAKDSFKIEVEGHKPYTYEFTAGDVYNLAYYSETFGKTFIARNEDNETIHVKMTGPLSDNVTYTPVSSNPVLDFTNATATLTKTTFLKQIDEMLIPAASGEVFIFDVDGDNLTEDPDNPGGKHYGTTLTSPTFEEIMDNLVANKLVFVKINYNNGNSSEIYQLFRTSASSIRGKAFDLEFPQGYIWFYDIYVQKRNYETTTYFGVFADKVSDGGGGGADFQIAHIPGGGGTGEEVKAILSKDADAMSVSYYKDTELPDTVNMSVGNDQFEIPTKGYVDSSAGVFVLDADNPCSYNALQAAINAPKSVFVKFGGKFYPLVDKWENDEGSKRYVNLATLQRPTADKGVTYFFFEALLADLESPMAYSSNYEQPYGKAYVDGKTGDLTTLTTDNKGSLVAAINEVYEKSGEPFRVKNWAVNNLNATIVPCTSDTPNTQLSKMTYSITGEEGVSYQIVGMIAYEVFDAESGGNRINCWPVCQFTGQGQKELSVRWVCAGTTNKTAKRINAWVLLKHR